MRLNNTCNFMKSKECNQDFDAWAICVGLEDRRCLIHSGQVNEDTYFDVASMGKVLVTSTLILQLVQQGKLALTDRLDRFFPDAPEDKRHITVQQLLTHSSGIVRTSIPEEIGRQGRDAVAAHILRSALAYEPGTNYIYSCNGYILLGYLLELVYGMTLEEIFNQQLAKPLGLDRSKFSISVDEPNAAVCYRCENPGTMRFDDENIRSLGNTAGSGGQFWSVGNLETFVKAVMNRDERLYAGEIFDLAEQDYTPNFQEGRGLGYLMVDERYVQTGKLFPAGSFGHCGHTGMSIFLNRKLGLYVIIATNATRFANKRNHFKGYDYGDIMKMREDIHNEILKDLLTQGLLQGGHSHEI